MSRKDPTAASSRRNARQPRRPAPRPPRPCAADEHPGRPRSGKRRAGDPARARSRHTPPSLSRTPAGALQAQKIACASGEPYRPLELLFPSKRRVPSGTRPTPPPQPPGWQAAAEWAQQDSNLRHALCKSAVLTAERWAPTGRHSPARHKRLLHLEAGPGPRARSQTRSPPETRRNAHQGDAQSLAPTSPVV